jgi:polyisoprenoid-binding protein YceI
MKAPIFKVATLFGLAALFLTMFIISCNDDDTITPLTNTVTSGTDKFENISGGDFAIDKTHTNVNWKTLYQGGAAWLNGKFNNFDIKVNFDEANPANTTITAWVLLSSFNTGEPGRDNYGKCGPGYMGVIFDTIAPSSDLIPRGSTDTARFVSKSVTRFGDGYMVKGDLTFKDATTEIMMPMKYTGFVDYESSTGAERIYAGLTGEFTMMAREHGVTSTSIADEVIVYINANFRKNL